MRKHVLPIVVLSIAFLQFARGAVISIFGDDFESGTMASWTATSTTPSPLDPFTPTNAAPPLGQWSAFMNVSTDRMHRNIIGDNGGAEATGHLMFSAWIYDEGVNSGTTGATRVYNELRGYSGGTGLPNGGTTAGGALAQLLAAGKFNSVTLPGEVFTSTKYQGRVAFHSPQPVGDTGWFNLNAPGSPNRSVGWHRFDIEVMPDGTTFKFYVDGILSRTFTGGTASTYDSLILGPGLGSQQGNAWIDGISVGIVDELPTISCPSNMTVYTAASSGAVVNYPAPVANDDGGAPIVGCNPPSGSTFPVGTTTVACTATDSRDQQARCSFQVTVRPVLIFRFSNSFARITLQLADGQTEEVSLTGGSDVELDLGEDGSAGDLDGDGLDDAAQRMTALTLDGTSQSLGPVRLRLRESPSRGLTEETSNGQAGILDLPPYGEGTANSFFDVFVEILAGNQVFHTATPMHIAASLRSVPLARGDRYTETTSHDILDANGNFTGIRLLRGIYIPMPEMVDIICPPNMVVWGEGPTAVTYIPLAQTDCGPPLTITCNPPSGSSFPVGTTFVQCTATDACGNTDECHFFVKVKSRRLQYVNFNTDGLPSPQGMYVSSFDVRYGNGAMLRNVTHRNSDPSYPPPALGDTATHEFDAQVSFDFSTDGGATYAPATAPARMVVRITHTHDEDGTQFFDTEMLAMDITGGSLPPGAMLRESPTRASLGKTQIRRGGGGYQIGSFFDVFTELSMDGGMNWSEAEEGSYMDLAFDPTKIPPVAGPSPNLPPRNDVYVTRPQLAQMYGDGIMIRNVRHRYFSQSLPPPPPGESRLYEFDALVDFQLSLDGGNQWQPIRANGRTAVVLQHSGRLLDAADQPATHLYASEVLQLDISGGDLPPGVRLRESPTRASTGGTALRQAQAPQGTHHIIHSFFDIFTELTLDGGMTWQQPPDPARLELQCYAPETEQPNDMLPPPQGEYGLTGLDPVVSYESGAQMLKDLVHESFSLSLRPPPFGQSQLHQFRSQVSFQHSGDGGQTWLPYEAIADFVVQVVNIGTNHIDHFDAEILQMNISGGTLPAGILIRESPTKQSLGRTSIQSPRDPASGFGISSFFDIWTELTVNGGQTWMPADGGAANVSLHLDRTEGTLMCADGMPLTNCPVTIQFYNQNGLAASTTGTTDINGYFNVLLNASGPHFNSYFVITTPCCGHTWTIPSSSPWGNLGQLTCDRCGEAPCVTPPTNMVAWWTFDEPPGPIAHDLMGFNNQGGRQNGPAVIAGKVKNALCFNGVDQYVHVLNHPEVNFFGSCPNNAGESFTIDMWIKPDSVQGLMTILDKRDNPLAPRGYSMFIDNGRLGFQMADGIGGPLCGGGGACNNYIQTAASITAGAWHHVAVTVRRCDVSGNIGRLYVDGVNVFSFVPRQGDLSNPADLLIGMRHPSLGYNFFRGCIDEVEIFKRALTFEEIEAIYNAGSGGKCKPCNLLIQCPQEEVRAWTCNRSATVCFNVTATSNCGEVTVTCTPPSCSAFAVGTTPVNCEASDSSGSKTNCTFNVTVVQDTAAPVISCPTNRIERWVCPETAGAIVTWAVSATDDCDQNVTITCVPPSGSQFPPGLHTVTCTARDDCGQIDQCRFEVNVTADTNAPVVTCPGDIREWTCETNGMQVNYVISVSDDCDLGPTVICSPPSGGFFPIGTTTVTCVARDRCGNQSLCEFRVTVVQDVEPPSLACPTDFRFDDCQEHEVNWIIGVIDDCDPRPGVVCTPPAGSVFPIGTTTVTCVATDQCGNSTTCSFKVEINCRCVPPPAGMVDWWTFDEASGPIANDIMGFNNLGVHMNGPTVIAGKVKNALCFNGDNQWVEVRDHPEINFLGDCSNDVGESFTIDAWIRLDSNGLQGVRTFLDKRNNPSSPQGYSFYVVNGRLGFQMANGVGNNICNSPGSACNNYVEPNPSITPGVWHFVAVTVQRCRGMGTLYVDGNPVLTFTPLSGDLNNPADMYIGVRNPAFGGANFPGCIDELEIFKRALSQTELQSIYNAGSGGKCKPCIRCPNDITVTTCDQGTNVCYDVAVSPDCEGITVRCEPPPCSFFPANTSTLVKCEAIDATGVVVEQCEFAVTVIGDTRPPTITCPADITVPNDPGACGAKVDYIMPQAGDNCPGATVTCTPPSGSFFPFAATLVTCTATDGSGNTATCTFSVIVRDVEPPIVVCPPDIRREACRETVIDYSVTVSDNCPNPTVTCVPPSGSPFPVGTTTVTCTATDSSGNSAGCTFKVELRCPCAPPPAGMVDWWTFDEAAGPTAADIAGFNNVGIHVNGPTVVTGKVDNALCFNGDNQYVQVRDHPEVNFLGSCVAGAAPAESFTIDAWIRADDVQGVRTILDKRVNPSDPIGYSLFIGNGRLGFQMADGSGGGGVCGPTASCQNYGEPTPSITPGNWHFIAVTVQRCDPNGGPGAGSLYVDGNLVLTFTPRTGNMNNPSDLFIGIRAPAFGPANFRGCIDELEYFKRALTPAEIQAIYNAGSAGKCKPCLHCPEDITVTTCNPNGTDVCYQMPRECPGLTIRCEPPPCSFFPANTSTLVTCQAIDATGQTVERCQFAVTVLGDRERPTITCPPDLSGTVDPGQCSRFVTYPPIQASDNCPGVTVSCDPPSGFPFPVGTTTVTCTATDAAGNTNACTWTVTVRDHYNPTITCPQDITVRSCDRRTRVYYKPTATDNCPGVTVVCVPPSGSLFPAGSHPVTCTATDASGNTASCSFKVTVIVLPPPKLEITYIGQGMVRICWESECPGWRLQCTRSLNPAVMWQFVSAPVTTNGNRYCVTLPARGAHQFYRLCRREPSPIEASDDLVPPLGTYRSPNDVVTAFIMGDPDRPLLMRGFAHPIPPNTPRRPPPCETCPPEIHLIQTELSFQVSSDGGDTWLDGAAQSEGDIKIKPGALDRPGDGRDTEIMRLEAQGQVGGRPIRIRESPTLPSLGRTYIDPDSDGDGYSVDSFFDVFIEISMDGGNTWVPAETATPLDLLR